MVSNLEVIESFHQAMEDYWRSGDDTALVAVFDPDCKFSVPGMPDTLEGMRQVLPAFRQAFRDRHPHWRNSCRGGLDRVQDDL